MEEADDNEITVDKDESSTIDEMKLAESIVAIPATSDTSQQFFVLSQHQHDGLSSENIACGNICERPAKLIRIEGDDGQTYLLAVATTGANVGISSIASLQKTEDLFANITCDIARPQLQNKDENATMVSGGSKKVSKGTGDDVTQAWFTTRDDKKVMQRKGHTWKQGQWTKDETDLLMDNIDVYCKTRNIKDPTEIIFEMAKDERKDFYRTIAHGLQRPLFSVYRRVTRMYDHKNHMGKYTPEEMNKLRQLRIKHGNDWSAIGAVLGRSASSVKDKCRLMKETCNAGKWLPEEERRLSAAVYDLAGAKMGESVTHGLSWAAVADRVYTRSEKQCRTKWLNYLNWKQKGGPDWTRQDDINLILKISSLSLSDDTEIDWNELSRDWPSVRSPQWLRGKWWSLKRHVPDYQDLMFADVIDILKTMHYQLKVKAPTIKVQIGRQASCEVVPSTLPSSLTLDGSDDSEATTFQAYEVLQQWTPNSASAMLISQAASISFNDDGSIPSDHIVVHSLPLSQSGTELKSGENVTVQLNPEPHVIISGAVEDSMVTSIQLPNDIDVSDQECHQYELSSAACQLIDTQGEIINGQHILTTTAVGTSVSDTIVVLEPTSPPHFSQSNSSDATELMSGLSDPILTSDATELMGSTSDCETDKNQSGLN